MIYIGIDSSLACTAIGVITRDGAGKVKLMSYAKIPTEPSMPYIERCSAIASGVVDTIKPYYSKSEKMSTGIMVGIEMPNSFRGGDVTRKLCGLYGILLHTIKNEFDIDAKEINTMHAKKISTGFGSAKKDKIVKSINKIFSLSLRYSTNKNKSDDDVADALSIAYCMYIEDSSRSKTIKKRRKRR
jgi:Holliday junction resolvasome RuvABC endonuclease subunit